MADAKSYARAAALFPTAAGRLAHNREILARWLDDQDILWCRIENQAGWRFWLGDPASKALTPAFDHNGMATNLTAALGCAVDCERLPIDDLAFAGGALVGLVAQGRRFARLPNGELEAGDALQPNVLHGPRGRSVFSDLHNLVLREAGRADRPLTTDGARFKSYGSPADWCTAVTGTRSGLPAPLIGSFSPDGRWFLSFQLDESHVPEMTLVEHAPALQAKRPRLWSYRCALPFDRPPIARLALFDLDTGDMRWVQHAPILVGSGMPPAFEHLVWSAGAFFFIDHADSYRTLKLWRGDPETGATQMLIEERADTNQYIWLRPDFAVLGSGEILWPSQRSGWEHLYLHGPDGAHERALTSGPWCVREILCVDEARREAIFSGAGLEPGDPYLRRLYKVSLDGGAVQRIENEPADHEVIQPRRLGYGVASGRANVAASGKYFVDAYSALDTPTHTVVRASDGAVALELARAERTREGASISAGETFRAIAADGRTEIWGALYLPSDFDPSRKYPIIDVMYGGPQVTFVPKRFMMDVVGFYGRFLAELGFVVVNMDGRGTPLRSRAFLDAGYRQLGKAGFLEDHIAALRQLAASRPYIDLDRVGAYGYSGGGFAVVHALLDHPSFYKAGVAVSPYDPELTVWGWGERFMGPYDPHLYAEQASYANAKNLSGALMLMNGDLDEVTPLASTLRIADALTAANKTFDLIVVPNTGHELAATPYALRRTFDFFVQRLLGAAPPSDFSFD